MHILLGVVIGAVIGAALSAIVARATGRPVTWKGVLAGAVGGAVAGGVTAATLGLGGAAATTAARTGTAFVMGGAAGGGAAQTADNVLEGRPAGEGVVTATVVGGVAGGVTYGAGRALAPVARRVFAGGGASQGEGARAALGASGGRASGAAPSGGNVAGGSGTGAVGAGPAITGQTGVGQAGRDMPRRVAGGLGGDPPTVNGAVSGSGVGGTVSGSGTGGTAGGTASGAGAGQQPAMRGIANALREGGGTAGRTTPTGVRGGKPTGPSARLGPRIDDETRRSLIRENESADALARAGFRVEQNPRVTGTLKNPDLRVEGRVFDVYSPSGSRPLNIVDAMARKVSSGQTQRIVLNLDDSSVLPAALRQAMVDRPIPGLQEVVVVRGGRVITFFPF